MPKRIIRKILKRVFYIQTICRNFFWKLLFGKFGKHSNVFGKIIVYYPENVELGDNSTLNEGVLLNARAKIKIGNFVHISPYCILNTGGLNYKKAWQRDII